MEDEFQRRLEAAFYPDADGETIRGVTEGILLADDLLENTPLLKNAVGRDLRGHIRRSGIIFRLHDLCARGDLPFTADIVPMPHGNWHWLEIRSENFKAHICRSEKPYDFPEETLSRQDARLVNQNDLFAENVVPLKQIINQVPDLYAWLTFGAEKNGSLKHLCWAMPPADDGFWLAHINIVERAKQAEAKPRAPEEPAKVIKLKFRDHIEESLIQQNQADKDKK
ncbi:hypothetical protein AB8B02_02640 [Tardiphaga sp. 862_B3_N4_1]|uniref:hypothetical protein n=1 Tax=Tardiphaga sp. 862_B3_N4_1 TaxID=3240764 RepID=UPI003F299763